MSSIRRLSLGLLLFAFVSLPLQARADPIQIPVHITGGFMEPTLFGSAHFRFSGDGVDATIPLEPGRVLPAETCSPCAPGDLIDLGASFTGTVGHGTATINGTTYFDLTFDGMLDFAAPSVVTPSVGGGFSVARPFTFGGRVFVSQSGSPFPMFDLLLTGQGNVVASFTLNSDQRIYFYKSARYDFRPAAPVPEPTTLLLFGTGAGALLRCRKRLTP
jgi:hypothetical protein